MHQRPSGHFIIGIFGAGLDRLGPSGGMLSKVLKSVLAREKS
jgi:hypothetical protein